MALKNDKQLQMRVDDAFLQKIDEWRHAHKIPTRADAIRKLVEAGMRIPDAASELVEKLPQEVVVGNPPFQHSLAHLRKLLEEHFQGVNNAAEAQIRDILNRVVHGQEVDIDDLNQTLEWVKQSSLELKPGESLLAKAAEKKEQETRVVERTPSPSPFQVRVPVEPYRVVPREPLRVAARNVDKEIEALEKIMEREVARISPTAPTLSSPLDEMQSLIVRAFNPEALAEFWRTFNGKTKLPPIVFTEEGRSSLQGLAGKIQAIPRYKAAASRYVDDYERYLDSYLKDPLTEGKAHEEVTSARGKIYTFLAHALGKL
jgi:hypothetical protein